MQPLQTSGSEGIEFARQALFGDPLQLANDRPASMLSACSELIFRVTGERIQAPKIAACKPMGAGQLSGAAVRSKAMAELSPHGAKMFLTLLAIAATESGNASGQFAAQLSQLQQKGWRSQTTAIAALRELTDSGLLECMSPGSGRRPAVYKLNLAGIGLSMADGQTIDWKKARPAGTSA